MSVIDDFMPNLSIAGTNNYVYHCKNIMMAHVDCHGQLHLVCRECNKEVPAIDLQRMANYLVAKARIEKEEEVRKEKEIKQRLDGVYFNLFKEKRNG